MARILVVEDNPSDLKLASAILKSERHEVVPARDAREAERILTQGTPDLIVIDLGLPGKDGVSLTRELRSRPETARLPIMAVTSYTREEDEWTALEAGCDAYLRKPIDRRAFLRGVSRLVTLRTGR